MTEQARIITIGASLGLSPKESAIAALIRAEAPDKQIVASLGHSHGTLRTHLERIRQKLKARGRVGVGVAWALAENADSINADMRKNRKGARLKPA